MSRTILLFLRNFSFINCVVFKKYAKKSIFNLTSVVYIKLDEKKDKKYVYILS